MAREKAIYIWERLKKKLIWFARGGMLLNMVGKGDMLRCMSEQGAYSIENLSHFSPTIYIYISPRHLRQLHPVLFYTSI